MAIHFSLFIDFFSCFILWNTAKKVSETILFENHMLTKPLTQPLKSYKIKVKWPLAYRTQPENRLGLKVLLLRERGWPWPDWTEGDWLETSHSSCNLQETLPVPLDLKLKASQMGRKTTFVVSVQVQPEKSSLVPMPAGTVGLLTLEVTGPNKSYFQILTTYGRLCIYHRTYTSNSENNAIPFSVLSPEGWCCSIG